MATTVVHEKDTILFGKDALLSKSRETRFAELIFELLAERAPTKEECAIFELILNLSIDHGPDTPSAQATIQAAQSGLSISKAVATGIQEINTTHGGAQEDLMRLLYEIDTGKHTPVTMVQAYTEAGNKVPGFGHRMYKESDPRTSEIFSSLIRMEKGKKYIATIEEVRKEIAVQMGKQLPINIDGAIAAALCTFGWAPRLGTAVFIIARTPGLCGQFLNNARNN